MKKILNIVNKIKSNPVMWFSVVALILISVLVGTYNYQPGTILSGWDNLHPEFNLSANLTRTLFSTWQEYQGLGLLGGMGHGADLVRIILIWLLRVFFSVESIRWVMVLSSIVFGSLGINIFVSNLLKDHPTNARYLVAFVSGCAYIFNLGTLQNYYVPFEPFYWYYAILPWLFYSLNKYVDAPTSRNLLYFGLTCLIASPIGYLQTGFLVLFIVITVLLFSRFGVSLIRSGYNKDLLTQILLSVKALGVLVITNLFWLLPVIYFTLTSSSVTVNSKMNQIATSEVHWHNSDFSGVGEVTNLVGYWMTLHDWSGSEGFQPLLRDWPAFLQEPTIVVFSSIIVLSMIAGVVSLLLKKTKFGIGIVIAWVVGFIFLSQSGAYQIIVSIFPLIDQIFRSPFTKWVVPMTFFTSLFVSLGVYLAISFVEKSASLIGRIGAGIVAGSIVIILFLRMLPVLNSNLIYSQVILSKPQAYFDLYDYFVKQPKESRIAFFPVHTFWGWNFYDWGYRGSGFLWYGIEQPILDRAFDVWSKYNETYYHETSTALYSEQPTQLARVFEKYDVSYVLLDESVIIPGGSGEILRYDYIKSVLPQIGAEVVWQDDFLTVYKLPTFKDSFVSAPENYTYVNADLDYTRVDPIHSVFGDYINDSDLSAAFPFSDLSKENLTDEVSYSNNAVTLTAEINLDRNENLHIPAFDGTYAAAADVSFVADQVDINFRQPYEIKVDENKVTNERILPRLAGPLATSIVNGSVWINGASASVNSSQSVLMEGIKLTEGQGINVHVYDDTNKETISLNEKFFANQFDKCWEREGRQGQINARIEGNVYKISSQDAVGCNAISVGALSKDTLVKVNLPYKSQNGARPHFCLQLEGTSDCLHEDIFYHSTTAVDWSTVSRQLQIPQDGNYWLVIMGRPPDDPGKIWEIEYQAPSVEATTLTSQVTFVPEVLDQLWNEKSFQLNSDVEILSVTLPLVANKVLAEDFRAEPNTNCDILDRGLAEKLVRAGALYYSAERYGAFCDFAGVNLSTQGEYLMRLQGENTTGRSVKAFLYNLASGRNDLEVLLDEGEFDNTYSILPWPLPPNEYSLTLETRSFGQQSSNKVESVYFYDFPISWLSKWRIGEVMQDNSSLEIVDSSKSGTAYYKVNTSGNGLLKLSQGYDNGWIAFSFGIGFLEHVKVNSWANGWMVPEGEQTIHIFFWPQLLQWAGFAAIPSMLIIILSGKYRHIRIPKIKVDKLPW